MSEEVTKINDHEPIFDKPISADIPRRQFDRKLLESHDVTQERIRTISSRLTRVEVIFESVNKDLRRLEEVQKEMSSHLEATASAMSAISHKLSVHSEMEEYQWTQVNEAHALLGKVGATLHEHLQSAESMTTRVDWIERMTWALWGVIGASAATLIPVVLKGLGL